jgi:hypothetical protein
MKSYLCANRHHFHSERPVCPTPECTAEVRPTSVHPLHGAAPAFDKLPKLSGADPLPAPETKPEAASADKGGASGTTRHSVRWWTYVDGARVRWAKGCDNDHTDATCACGWDSATGRSPEITGEPLNAVKRLVKAHKEGIL